MSRLYHELNYQHLFRLLIQPILNLKPDKIGYEDWMHAIFGVEHRVIERFRLKETASMPGDKMATPGTRDYSAKPREYPKDTEIWMRHDRMAHDHYDIEIPKFDEIYRLSSKQWIQLNASLLSWPFREQRTRKLSWEGIYIPRENKLRQDESYQCDSYPLHTQI